MLGVLLVLASIIVGARVFASADDSVTVWGLASDVSAGTQLTDGDLESVQVNLYDDTSSYFPTTTSIAGKVASHDLHAGDLLPRSALESRPQLSLLSLSVEPARVPAGVGHGDRVDVYAGGSESTGGPTTLVLERVVVQTADYGGSGALSSTDEVRLTVQVSPELARASVPKLADKSLYVVQLLGDGAPATTPK